MASTNPTTSAPLKHRIKRFLLHTRRRLYGMRRFVPWMAERHRLELLVGPLGFWDPLQKYHLELLTKNGLRPEHRVLDIGCGPLLAGIPVIRMCRPGAYVGIDVDPVRIEAAKGQIKANRFEDKKPHVFVSKTFGEPELGNEMFDFVWASQVIYYFDDATMGELFEMIRKRLNPGGKFLCDTFELDHYEFKFPEHPGGYVRHTPESLQKIASKYGLKVRQIGTIEQFGYPKRLSLRTNMLFEVTKA